MYGAGGCGRGLLPLLRHNAEGAGVRLIFIDDATTGPINDHDVVTWKEFNDISDDKRVCLAVASPKGRERLARKVEDAGIELLAVTAPDVVRMDDVGIGRGACLSPGVILTSNIRIGIAFHANLGSFIEHDAFIGDCVTLAPGVRVNGNVRIGDRAYVGAGALIRQGISVGDDAVVGMGAVVLEDVAPGRTVVGNPAREIG
ncbi:MAG: acetyltransferase [Hyphomicrobiales bacterium]